ncbi:MAG TPA: LuxR C-terminal-related transcriptional regulator [Anaerolineales bacterium]|nr:LuxR C-terminal-related transcriptional regulator [Anaerolineales bacterium]
MGDRKKKNIEFHVDDLTWRERDILNLLTERLSNREIADRLFLAESSVKDYVGNILKKLYVKNRRQAVERARELGFIGDDSDSASNRKSNLPSSATPFIGRKGELAEIRLQLGKTRLLTLTGSGGMGKTRLALKTAEDSVDDFRDGCFFVSLAPIHSIDHIVQSIAEAVSFPIPTQEDPKHQLLRYLQKKNLLLIMDNFEHLMEGTSIVSEIIENTSGVKVLATSRERLNLKSESVLNIAGMSEANNDAIALFLQSGAKAQSGFKPSSDEMEKIENICRFVGGMPLAIELAASWLHVLSVGEINDELQKGLDILEFEAHDAPERHHSIRAVFDQSWSLLDQREQEILMRLSIFRGGFTREAAGQVTGASLKQVSGLVNKSILKHDPTSGRFEIHELLRQYAQEKLERTSKVSDTTIKAHAAYYADFMLEKWGQLRGLDQIPALVEIEADIENIRAAWRYYLVEQSASQLKKFLHGFWLFYWVRGWIRSAIELFTETADDLAQAEHDPDIQAVRAAALGHLAFFVSWVGLAEDGYKLAKKSIKIGENLEPSIELAFAYHSLTLPAYYLNQPVEEKDAAQRYLEIVEASNDKSLMAYGYFVLSLAEFRLINSAESKRLAEIGLKLSNEIDDTINAALCLTALAGYAMRNKDYAAARECFTRCLQIAKQVDFYWLTSNARKYLGQIALFTDDIPSAQEYLTQSLRVAYDLGLDRDITNHLYEFANLRAAQTRLEDGVELISLLLVQPSSHLTRVEGGSIRDRAKKLLAELENKLPQETYDAALKRGELLNVDDVVVELLAQK